MYDADDLKVLSGFDFKVKTSLFLFSFWTKLKQ